MFLYSRPMVTSVDVILTYYKLPQERMTLSIPITLSLLTEEALLTGVFRHLPRKRVAEVLKISCALAAPNFKALPSFIRKNNGNFFFNVEDNLDADTLRYAMLKLEYLSGGR